MTASDHNKPGQTEPNVPGETIQSLGDLHSWISRQPQLSLSQKAQLRSAIKRCDELLGHGAFDLPANPRVILNKLDQFSPAMAGLSRQAFANLKSLVRKTFQLATPALQAARSGVKLSGVWRSLEAEMDKSTQRDLSRFLRFACSQGWQPPDISNPHVERFNAYLRDQATVLRWDDVVRSTIRAWNRLAEDQKAVGLQQLTPPPSKRTSYWIAQEKLPEGLRSDLAAYLEDISTPSVFAGVSGRRYKPATINQHKYAVITLASALVAAGESPSELTSISHLIRPDNLGRALTFLFERAGKRVTEQICQLAFRARVLARWAKLPIADLEQLDELVESIRDQAPGNRGMTKKNRTVVRNLENANFRDRLLLLPALLLRKAYASRSSRLGAACARAAVAIELLLTCSMRRENLLELKLGENLCRIGSDPTSRWIIELPPEDVKNEEPLRFQLLPETVEILERYLCDWRGKCSSKPSPWLFPNAEGERLNANSLSENIAHQSERELGVRITPHQFRHLSTELYLQENPEGLAVASLHLGHRDQNTTRRYYARPKQLEATRRYHEHLIDKRDGAKRRQTIRRRCRSDSALPVDTEGDAL